MTRAVGVCGRQGCTSEEAQELGLLVGARGGVTLGPNSPGPRKELVERDHLAERFSDDLWVEAFVLAGRAGEIPGVDEEVVEDHPADHLLEGKVAEGARDHARGDRGVVDRAGRCRPRGPATGRGDSFPADSGTPHRLRRAWIGTRPRRVRPPRLRSTGGMGSPRSTGRAGTGRSDVRSRSRRRRTARGSWPHGRDPHSRVCRS